MRYRHFVLAMAVGGTSTLTAAAALAQQPGMGRGMGIARDSATQALAMGSHQLVMNHDRIKRSVTNLPNGIRTVTESGDPQVAALIREHVTTSLTRLATGNDPGLPMETPALRSLFRNSAKIKTSTEETRDGILVIQTSNDAAVVAELQKHAAEVTKLVERGMAALHESMHSGAMPMGASADTHSGHDAHAERGASGTDSAFKALQERGKRAMGVDQYTSTHHFDALPDGGRIELQRDVDDTLGVATIRTHLQDIVKAFAAGDFTTPAFVHMQEVPGAKVMAASRGDIKYTYRDLPRGGEVRIQTKDAQALSAIHEFLAFQRSDHRAH